MDNCEQITYPATTRYVERRKRDPVTGKGKLGELLAGYINERGFNQREAADAAGLTPTYIHNLLSGKRKRISLVGAEKLSRALGIPINRLLKAVNLDPGIPIVGHIAAGKLDIVFTDMGLPAGGALEYVDRPEDLTDPNGYALRIRGDSMSPAYNNGDTVIVDTKAPVVNGDKAIVRVKTGEAYFKIYRESSGIVTLESINPGQAPISFPLSDLVLRHKVRRTIHR